MIGVALVTAVTVVAQGLEDEGRGALERRVQAHDDRHRRRRLVADRPQGRAGGRPARHVSSMRQDGALVFGHQEGVNGVDPATIGGFYRYDFTAGWRSTWARRRASSTRASRPSTACSVGSTLRGHVDERQDARPDRVAAIEKSPVLDVLGLGPITISHAAFDATFEQQRNRLTFVDGPQDAVAKALAAPSRTPRRGQGRLHRRPDGLDRDDPRGPVGAARARRDRLACSASSTRSCSRPSSARASSARCARWACNRRQVRRMVRHESVITALIGAVLGIARRARARGGGRRLARQVRAELRGPGRRAWSRWRSSPRWRACSPPRCPPAGPRGSTS